MLALLLFRLLLEIWSPNYHTVEGKDWGEPDPKTQKHRPRVTCSSDVWSGVTRTMLLTETAWRNTPSRAF